MTRLFRFSPSKVALGYIALSVLALALFAIPLWYAWTVNVSTFRAYIQGEDMQRLVDVFDREGAKGLAAAMESQVRTLPGDEVMFFADASKRRLAGNLPAWPAEVPEAPGTYGLVIDLGGGSSMRVVVSHVKLPGGYHFLMGRESVRFQSLVELFWYGIAGATGIVLVLGAVVGWIIRRALLSEVQEISRAASAIVEGDLSRRLPARGGSAELDTLAHTVNGMLEQLHRAQGESLRRSEAAVRAAKARFEGILEIADDAIISVDSKQRIILFNQGAEKAFGYSEPDVIGKPLNLLMPARFAESHRGHIEAFSRTSEVSRSMAQRREVFGRRKDGSEFPAEACISKLDLGNEVVFTVILRDITERKQAEGELQKQKAYLDELFDLAPDAIVLTDLSHPGIVRVNKEFTRMFGYTPEEAVGRRLRSLIAPDDLNPAELTENPDLLAGQTVEREVVRQRKDGTRFYAHITAKRVRLRYGEDAAYIIYRDITERKEAEEALRRSERQLRRAQTLEAMGTLAGGIAHDFNNILGAILGYGEMALRDAPRESRLRRDLKSITAAGERGRALVDRILAFSRSGVGERVAVHVEKVVRESLDLLMANLPGGVTVKAELRAGRAAMRGDPTQVHQVVMNLATNGIQAMEPGGMLRISLSTVRLDTHRVATTGTVAAGDYIQLKVADAGRGIPAAILDRIFDPFFTTKEVGVGTGLGLSLVHGIVTEVGGAVDVETAPGAGSTFTVYLPRAGDAADGSEDEQPDLPRGDQQRVLVVDDEEPLVRLTTETLQDLGYMPVGFTSSTDALEAFRADPERFDAVITDERMPVMSGSALIREMRGIRRTIPILLVSGYVGGMVAGRAFNSGANEVLKKPLSARELATSLARMLHLQ